jgi:ribose 5-phosphate isomerase A
VSRVDDAKQASALAAARLIESGMVLGLGSGSTADHLTQVVGEALARGELSNIVGVPTSARTEALAASVGIELIDLPASGVDLAIDGMDEVTPELDALKGLGGALLREKVVAQSARRFVLIGDDSKRVMRLGERAPIPVEVLPFGWRRSARRIAALGLAPALRGNEDDPYVSDNGNLVIDAHADAPFDAAELDRGLLAIPGVLAHGLFLGTAQMAFLAGPDGVSELVR